MLRTFIQILVVVFLTLAAVSVHASPTLTWTNNPQNTPTTSTAIDRAPAGGTPLAPTGAYANIGTVGPGVATYVDASAVLGSYYCYQVRAFDATGSSAPSNPACMKAVPGGLGVTALLIQAPEESESVSHGLVQFAGSTGPGQSVLTVRVDNTALATVWSKSTGAWTAKTTLTRIGAHRVSAAAFDSTGQLGCDMVAFEVR